MADVKQMMIKLQRVKKISSAIKIGTQIDATDTLGHGKGLAREKEEASSKVENL